MVLGIYLLLLLSGDHEMVGWNRFHHGGSVEDGGDNYGVSILTGMTTWRLLFPNGGIKAEMVLPSWNNFLRSLLCFVVVRSDHNEGLERISFRSVFLILRWQKEDGRHKKKKFLSSACREVCCGGFAGAVIHTKRQIGLVLRSGDTI